jgi:hypothetical protein
MPWRIDKGDKSNSDKVVDQRRQMIFELSRIAHSSLVKVFRTNNSFCDKKNTLATAGEILLDGRNACRSGFV